MLWNQNPGLLHNAWQKKAYEAISLEQREPLHMIFNGLEKSKKNPLNSTNLMM